jgi:tRNA U38,U39,U40 pseudouridine synthase TruA
MHAYFSFHRWQFCSKNSDCPATLRGFAPRIANCPATLRGFAPRTATLTRLYVVLLQEQRLSRDFTWFCSKNSDFTWFCSKNSDFTWFCSKNSDFPATLRGFAPRTVAVRRLYLVLLQEQLLSGDFRNSYTEIYFKIHNE